MSSDLVAKSDVISTTACRREGKREREGLRGGKAQKERERETMREKKERKKANRKESWTHNERERESA
jgi:hypothetical protein